MLCVCVCVKFDQSRKCIALIMKVVVILGSLTLLSIVVPIVLARIRSVHAKNIFFRFYDELV